MTRAPLSPLPWRHGASSGAIVTDCPHGEPEKCPACDGGGRHFYGGHCIAESISEADREMIITCVNNFPAVRNLLRDMTRADHEADRHHGAFETCWVNRCVLVRNILQNCALPGDHALAKAE